MTVARKLFAIVTFVAVAPLGVSAVMALTTYEDELDDNLAALHRRTAEHGAHSVDATLDSAQRTTRGLARAIPWEKLNAQERHGALRLIYEQLDHLAVVTLVDAQGQGVGSAIHSPPGTAGVHPTSSPDALATFGRAISTREAAGWTIGEPVVLPGHRAPVVPMSMPIVAGKHRWRLAIGLSLVGACDELAAAPPNGVTSRLVDRAGRTLCGPPSPADPLTASVKLAIGWHVVAEQPRDEAFSVIGALRRQYVFWLGVAVVAAICAGSILTLAIRRPLGKLTRGARALAAGNLGHRVALENRDELGAVGDAFDHMASEIQKKNSEIQRWNDELQSRVDERTAELEATQDQLLESRKLGAMAALGAGIAHEINNPLTGVLGMTQVLLARSDQLDESTLRKVVIIEREAQRVRDVVERMQGLAQDSLRDAVRLDVTALVDSVASARTAQFASANVAIERAYATVPRIIGNPGQLEDAIAQLVDNSIKAMPSGGTLRLAVRQVENELVAIDVVDTGRGIPAELLDKIFEPFFTTKDDWRGVGLGLALAHRIVEAHHGRIRAQSTVGSGTTMTVTLPAVRQGAHLA